MTDPTCDWCERPATVITRHDRPNTGTLVAYWCDEHQPVHQLRCATCARALTDRADYIDVADDDDGSVVAVCVSCAALR